MNARVTWHLIGVLDPEMKDAENHFVALDEARQGRRDRAADRVWIRNRVVDVVHDPRASGPAAQRVAIRHDRNSQRGRQGARRMLAGVPEILRDRGVGRKKSGPPEWSAAGRQVCTAWGHVRRHPNRAPFARRITSASHEPRHLAANPRFCQPIPRNRNRRSQGLERSTQVASKARITANFRSLNGGRNQPVG